MVGGELVVTLEGKRDLACERWSNASPRQWGGNSMTAEQRTECMNGDHIENYTEDSIKVWEIFMMMTIKIASF